MKRFYREATLGEENGEFRVLLDGRPVRTQGGRAQIVPTRALALAMVAEWAGQGETIDPERFAARDMADYAIDVIAPDPAAALAELLPYAETDTLCYRAEADAPIAAHQETVWEPLVIQAERDHGARFVRVSGIIHQPQPPATIAHLAGLLAAFDPFALAALRNLSSLTASMIVALAALEPDADLAALWDAAHLEETWQSDLWGKDAEAETRLARRRDAFFASARFAALARS